MSEPLHDCEWKNAILDACVVDWILTAEHENDPRRAVNDLLCWQQKIALDPAVSESAAKLHARIADSVPLSAIQALIQQWQEEGDAAISTAMEAEAKALFVTAGSENSRGWALKECADQLAALCPAATDPKEPSNGT